MNHIKGALLALSIFSLLSVSALATASDDGAAYYDTREKGWYWYEEPPVEEEEPEETKIKPVQPVAAQPQMLSPKEVLAQQKEQFDNSLALAVTNPTTENVREYLAMSEKVNSQAARFAKSVKETLWVTPEYDRAVVGRPNNPQALAAYEQTKSIDNKDILYDVAKEKGIIYFFRSDCPFCNKYSPILKKFAKDFGFTIIPVSVDGIATDEFPYPKTNSSMVARLGIEIVPATFLVDPDENIISTIGYGYTDWTTLVQKTLLANEKMSGQDITVGEYNND